NASVGSLDIKMSPTAMRSLNYHGAASQIDTRISPADGDIQFAAPVHLDQRAVAQAQDRARAGSRAHRFAFTELIARLRAVLAAGIHAIESSLNGFERSAISRRSKQIAAADGYA